VHAVVIEDGHLVYAEREDPVPGDTELLVEVQAAGINGADISQRAGFYPAPPGWPQDIPGMEMAGVVVGAGSAVTLFAPGDRVMALVGGGAQATLAYVDESHAMAVPDDLPWADALFSQAQLGMGERVLVSGAAGGVGTAGVQLAAATGATVVATVRDPERREAVAALGAHVVVAPGEEAAHGPYDVVLELVGAPSLTHVLPALATGARVVVIGVGGGAQLEVNLFTLMGKRARIGGSTLRGRSRREKADVTTGVIRHVLPLLAARRVEVPVLETFPFAEAEAAYNRFTEGHKLGKIVLVP